MCTTRELESPGRTGGSISEGQCRSSKASRPSLEGGTGGTFRAGRLDSGCGGSGRDRVPFPAAVERRDEKGSEGDEQTEGDAGRHEGPPGGEGKGPQLIRGMY